MNALEWLAEGAYVDRHVNMFYFMVVSAISLSVLAWAAFTENHRAIRVYLYALPVWAAIEGFGLVSGMRVYESHAPAVFFFVAFMEDAGWVTLAFMVSQYLTGASRRISPEGQAPGGKHFRNC